MATMTTVSGRTIDVPDGIIGDVIAVDSEGRMVVDTFDALAAPVVPDQPFRDCPFLFGLTLCCNAYDKGCEDGVYCRSCYGDDSGAYHYRNADGSWPAELDFIVVRPPSDERGDALVLNADIVLDPLFVGWDVVREPAKASG